MSDESRDWMKDAACKGTDDPDIFFAHPTDHRERARAIAFCISCRVKKRCQQAGESESYGTWGGQFHHDPNGRSSLTLQLHKKAQ